MIERVEGSLLSYGNEMTNKDFPQDCGLGKYCNLESDYDFIGKTALLKKEEVGFNKTIYQIQFDFEEKTKPLFYSNLPIFKKEQVIGKATSIVWSPKFSKYIGFFIANKDVKHDLASHYILNKVKFEMYEIN